MSSIFYYYYHYFQKIISTFFFAPFGRIHMVEVSDDDERLVALRGPVFLFSGQYTGN